MHSRGGPLGAAALGALAALGGLAALSPGERSGAVRGWRLGTTEVLVIMDFLGSMDFLGFPIIVLGFPRIVLGFLPGFPRI